jgi:transcriptional regulator NrdR family protein
MICPICKAWTQVIDSRPNKGGAGRYRRYQCANLHRFTTEKKIVGKAKKEFGK